MVSYSTHRMIEANTRLHHHEAVALASGYQQASGATRNSNLMLHVDGWYQQQTQNPSAVPAQPRSAGYIFDLDRAQHGFSADHIIGHKQNHYQNHYQQQQPQQQQQRQLPPSTSDYCTESLKRVRDTTDTSDSPASSLATTSACKRVCDDAGLASSSSSSSSSSSNHGGVRITDLLNPAVVSAAAAAQRMTLPSSLARTRSDGAKHQHQNITLMQQQQQRLDSSTTAAAASGSADPTVRFTRTATAPVEATVKTAAAYSSSCAQGLVREALELDKLYDIACVIIESAWPNHSISQRTQLCSLRCFVMETHRQSRLGTDVLELCMFYLLRAKSIIQAKQRAARQKEEQQEQEQQLKIRQQQLQQQQQQLQQQALLLQSMCSSASTPPLSPFNSLLVAGRAVPAGSSSNSIATPSSVTTNNEDSPYTPQEGQGAVTQVSYVPGDKQQILRAGMVAPFITVDAKQRMQQQPSLTQQRPLAGNAASLPVSYRSLVASAPNDKAVTASANAAQQEQQEQQEQQQQQQLQSPEEKALGDNSAAAAPAKKPKPDPTKCGRRMFVAALISASKFIYDQTYSNRAWNKITRLPMAQISDMERAFLEMIDYRLYVDRTTYDKFHRLLARSGMRNGRLMVCDTTAATAAAAAASPPASMLTPVSPSSLAVMPSSSISTSSQQDTAVVPGVSSSLSSLSSSWQVAAYAAPASVVTPFTPGPPSSALPAAVDLRTAMNVPLSISATPQISRTTSSSATAAAAAAAAATSMAMAMATTTTAPAQQMQEQVINILRVQQHQHQYVQH